MIEKTLPILVSSALNLNVDSIKSYDNEDLNDTLSKMLPSLVYLQAADTSK
jgi:hypothetical protein